MQSTILENYKKQNKYYGAEYFEQISLEEQEVLTKEIESWDAEDFKGMHELFKDYFALTVSDMLMKDFVKRHFVIAQELFDNTFTDTAARDIISDAFVKYVGARETWPKYSEKVNIEEFLENVRAKINHKEGQLVEQNKRLRKPLI